MNVPLQLTVMRIVCVPLVFIVYLFPSAWSHYAAAFLFLLAILTDWLDGYLARRLNQSTKLGAFLDPVADKILICVALVLVAAYYANFWITLASSIIVAREILISALREWMSEIGSRTKVSVQYVGKIKTTFQAIAIVALLMYSSYAPVWIFWFGLVFFYLAVILTLWSMLVYLKTAWPDLKQHSKN